MPAFTAKDDDPDGRSAPSAVKADQPLDDVSIVGIVAVGPVQRDGRNTATIDAAQDCAILTHLIFAHGPILSCGTERAKLSVRSDAQAATRAWAKRSRVSGERHAEHPRRSSNVPVRPLRATAGQQNAIVAEHVQSGGVDVGVRQPARSTFIGTAKGSSPILISQIKIEIPFHIVRCEPVVSESR